MKEKFRNSRQINQNTWNRIFESIADNIYPNKASLNEEERKHIEQATNNEYNQTDTEYRKTIETN